jgi:nucleotide-binding universal stress UspA family protein
MKAVLAIDGSPESVLGLETAASLSWPSGAQMLVLTVLPLEADWYGGPWSAGVAYVPPVDLRDRVRAERGEILEAAAIRLRRPGLEVTTRSVEGRAASVIVETARTIGADLIIVGARGHGAIERALLGSVSAEVVDQAPCPVLVARRRSAGRVLIGTDGSDVAISAARFVGECGLFASSLVRVVHAIDVNASWWLGYTPGDATFAVDAYDRVVTEARQRGNDVTSSLATEMRTQGFPVSTVSIDGPAAAVIVNEATSWGADLVVVGTRGNGLLTRLLLGSTARSVLHHADASVLIAGPATGVVPEPMAKTDPADAVPA